MEQLQALIEGPLKNLLSKKQLPFNETIKFQPEEIEDEHLGCVDSVLLECEMKKEGEVSKLLGNTTYSYVLINMSHPIYIEVVTQ